MIMADEIVNPAFTAENCDYAPEQIAFANQFVERYLRDCGSAPDDHDRAQRLKSACDAAHGAVCDRTAAT